MLKKITGLLCVFASCAVAACTTTQTASIKDSGGQLSLADSQLGEAYESVIVRAVSTYEVEPHCESRKVGLKNSRKAFLYAVCGFNPLSARFAKAPLAEVVYHFIDQKLVRVDVRAQGEEELLELVQNDMQQVFTARDAQSAEIGKGSYEWADTTYVAGVRAGGGANAGNVHVRLFEQSLTDSAPWLTLE